MKNLMKLIFLLLFAFSNAQQSGGTMSHLLINLGYSNLNGNYFKIGPEVYLVQTNNNLFDLSATANMAYFKDRFVIVPELGIGYQFNAQKTKKQNRSLSRIYPRNFLFGPGQCIALECDTRSRNRNPRPA